MDLLEQVKRRATKVIRRLEYISCEEEVFLPGEDKSSKRLIAAFQKKGVYEKDWDY